jgi:uncharacterized damage-inducible protein DinB
MPSIRDVAKQVTMSGAETLCKDTTYIPEEKLAWRPMEHGKSAEMILAEIARSNYEIAAAIRGQSPKEIVIGDFVALKDCVMESAREVCKAIDSLSDADLEGTITMPWGGMFAASEAILLPANHMVYHDGQINYIQLLLGDTRFHWAGE